jgi:hypothetical protein
MTRTDPRNQPILPTNSIRPPPMRRIIGRCRSRRHR